MLQFELETGNFFCWHYILWHEVAVCICCHASGNLQLTCKSLLFLIYKGGHLGIASNGKSLTSKDSKLCFCPSLCDLALQSDKFDLKQVCSNDFFFSLTSTNA